LRPYIQSLRGAPAAWSLSSSRACSSKAAAAAPGTASPKSASASNQSAAQKAYRAALQFASERSQRLTALAAAQAEAEAAPITMDRRIGFMGAGQMAEAMARGFLAKGLIKSDRMCCSDPNQERKDVFASLGITAYNTNTEVVQNCDVIMVAVKPQMVAKVLSDARPMMTPQHTIVSIAAGVTIEQILAAAGPDARVVRVMPNTPCMVGAAASAMAMGGKANAEDETTVRNMFESVGKIYTVDEKLLAAVTGVSGSGPAYVYIMIEALADGGVRAGLPRDIAQGLAAQTVMGSAMMVLETGKHPGALKDMVTSPGGTTIAGVHELEKAGVRCALMNAVMASADRAIEMSKL